MSFCFRLSAVLCVLLIVLYGNVLSADTINVPSEVATIQGAIDAASDGDEVVVAPGTYYENINFIGKAITVRSSSDDPTDTIIDADGSGSVVTCDSGESAMTVLQGFTLTGGRSDYGGGMYNYDNSNPTVTNCTFSCNEAGLYGGGMANHWNGSPTVANCILWGNSDGAVGNEIYNDDSTPTVTYSCIQGGYTGTGNIDSDPLFVDTQNDDLRLTAEPSQGLSAESTGLPAYFSNA